MGERLRPFSLIHALTIMTKPTITCHFWNVGQGLFSSGKIALPNNQEFVWVYDCGSANQKTILNNAIHSMKQVYQNDVIDLLVISHFDKDHIKGLPELLKNRKVKYWLLPYYPLWQRLFIALSLNFKPDSDEFNFCLNPAKFIVEHYSEYFSEACTLLFVPAQESTEQIMESNDVERHFSYQVPNEEYLEDILGLPTSLTIKFLDIYRPAIFNGVEIVPYNIALTNLPNKPTNLAQFSQDVNEIIQNTQPTALKIASLTKLYDYNFKQRNCISLFLYIGKTALHDANNSVNICRSLADFSYTSQIQTHDWGILMTKSALLYTGDGELKTPSQFQHLSDVLGSCRMINIFALQVPHHGSRNNWFVGLADLIKPQVSIFNADPTNRRYNHPHAEVVKDFLPYNPVLIDKHSAIKLTIQ